MKKCLYCGYENEEESQFCGDCGKTLNLSVEELVQLSKDGNEDAKNELIEKTKEDLFFVAYGFTLNEEVAANKLQEAYSDTLEQISALDLDFKLSVMKSLAKKCRKETGMPPIPVDASLVEEYDEGLDEEKESFEPVENEDYTDLKESVQSLSDNERMAITCVSGEGLSVEDTSKVLEISEDEVKANIVSGKKKIGALSYAKKIAPIPFLLWLLKDQLTKSALPNISAVAPTVKPVKQTTQTVVKATKHVSSATKATSASAAKTAAGVAGKTAVSKVVVGVVAAAVVGTGAVVGGKAILSNNETKKETEKTSEVAEKKSSKKEEKKDTKKENDTSVFNDVIDKYQSLIDSPSTGSFDENHDSGQSQIISDLETSGGGNDSGIGYAYVDLNDDGQDELLIGNTGSEGNAMIYDIYANVDGTVKMIKDETTKTLLDEDSTKACAQQITHYYTLTNKNKIVLHYDNNGDMLFTAGSFDGKKFKPEAKYVGYSRTNFMKLNLKTNEEEAITQSDYSKQQEKYSNTKSIKFTTFIASQPETATQQEESQETAVADSSSTSTSSMQTLNLKYMNATIQIPTNYSYSSGSLEDAFKEDMYYLTYNDTNQKLGGLESGVSINAYDNYPNQKTMSEAKSNTSDATYEFYGTENQYVVMSYNYSGSGAHADASVSVVDVTNSTRYIFEFMMWGESTPTQEQYEALYTIARSMAQSVSFH